MDINELTCDHRAFHLTSDQWEEFFRNMLVPMAEGNAGSMNKALELLVRGNRDSYTLHMEHEQVKRVAKILCMELIDTYDLDGDRADYYTRNLAEVYPQTLASMLDQHGIVHLGMGSWRGKLDLFANSEQEAA
mgnify:CR=1 FL=1